MTMDDIALVFSKLDMPKDHINFVLKKLYHYKDDPIVAVACKVVNDNIAHIENYFNILHETGSMFDTGGVKPLMMLTPNNPLSLRVYPNIPINNCNATALRDLSTLNCNSVFADLLRKYEEGKDKEHSKKAWEVETATKKFNEYIDMATSTALARYAELGLKPHQIRDLADKIDLYRKPLELIWATKPEDYVAMYTGGPGSCMTPDGVEKWKFLLDQGICPASMFAFMPHCKGAFIKKNGKTVARAVCYWSGPLKDNKPVEDTGKRGEWYYGRVYSVGTEFTNKFVHQLKELGISDGQGQHHNPPVGTTFKVKAYKKDKINYAAPISYADNMERTKWSATYDPAAKEFTFIYGSTDRNRIAVSLESRNGYIVSSQYMTSECTNCGKTIRGSSITPTQDSEEVFCTDSCAHQAGYIKVISEDNSRHYQLEEHGLIDIVGVSTVKYSTFEAAKRNSRHPVMDELGIIAEEGHMKVSIVDSNFYDLVDDKMGNRWVGASPEHREGVSLTGAIATNRIPFEVTKKKTVQYETDHRVCKQEFDLADCDIPF